MALDPPRARRDAPLTATRDGPPRPRRAAPRRLAAPERRAAPKGPERPSRLRLWLRRRRALLRPAGLGLLAAGALAVLGLGLYAADPAGRAARLAEGFADLGQAAGFRVREIVVEGRHNTPMELVRAAVGLSRDDSTLGFSPQEAKERLETIAWVQRAHVERRLPGTILVRLEERQPFAIWQHQGRFAVIDREGTVVTTERLDQFGPLPIVVGTGAARHAAALHDRIQAQPDLAARVQAMVRVGERRWNLRLHNGADVLLPEGAEAAAVERLAELHKRHGLLDRPVVAIDMRLPDRLVVRQHPQPEQPAQAQQRNRSRPG
jgi:cell division protein FtsQ